MSSGFCVVQIEYGSYGEMLRKRAISQFATNQDAETEADRLSQQAPQHGYNEENGYWWCRDLSVGKAYRYFVAG